MPGVMEEILNELKELNNKIDNMPVQGMAPHPVGNESIKEVLDAKEVAELLGVSRQTIYEHTKQGRIPHIEIGSAKKYPKKSIIKWMLETAEKNQIREKELETFNTPLELLS